MNRKAMDKLIRYFFIKPILTDLMYSVASLLFLHLQNGIVLWNEF